jgi:outer membrane biosynthesis protein TonB
MRPRIEEDPYRPGEGCARIVLPGMAGREAPAVTFTREGFGADSLGPDGWQVAAGRLTPIETGREGDDLVLVLGPEAAEHLHPGPVRLGIPALGIDQVVIWPEIAPAQAGRRGGFGANRPGQAPPRRVPGRVEPPPAPKPVDSDETVVVRPPPRAEPPRPAQPPRPLEPPPIRPPEAPSQPSRLPLILLALLLLAGGGAAAWWFWPAPGERQVALPAAPATPATPATPAAPATPADPTANATPAEIAAMNLPPARVLEIGQARQATRPQDALLLIELAADGGHAPAISALARLYDPATFTPGGALSMPNPSKAAELWRAAERAGDSAAAAPRAILRDRLETAAQGGDTVAQRALRDFWP